MKLDVEHIDPKDGQTGVIKLTLNKTISLPTEIILKGKDAIADYINDRLEDNPGYFGWFDEGDIEVLQQVKE